MNMLLTKLKLFDVFNNNNFVARACVYI